MCDINFLLFQLMLIAESGHNLISWYFTYSVKENYCKEFNLRFCNAYLNFQSIDTIGNTSNHIRNVYIKINFKTNFIYKIVMRGNLNIYFKSENYHFL